MGSWYMRKKKQNRLFDENAGTGEVSDGPTKTATGRELRGEEAIQAPNVLSVSCFPVSSLSLF